MNPVTLPTLTVETVQDFLPRMRTGQALIYHTGSLMYDRSRRSPDHRAVGSVAKVLLAAHERGEVTLVQRKTGEVTQSVLGPVFQFDYIAIKLPPPQPERKRRRMV